MRMTSLDLDFTRGCNMNCNHCFADAHSPMRDELTTEEYRTLLDEAAKYELSRVSWGLGGEALTRKDLFELLEHAAGLGLPQVLTTNAMLVTEEGAKRIAATGTRVSVSIDGATDETHESLRVIPGSLQLAIRGIKRLQAAGAKVGANITLTRHNVHELPDMLKLAQELELDYLSIGNIQPFGRALSNPDLLLTQEDLDFVVAVASEHTDNPVPTTTFDNVLDLLLNLNRILETGKHTPRATSAGRGKVVIRPNGEVWPCQLLAMPAGNIREKPLDEILLSPIFDEVRAIVEAEEKTGRATGGCAGCVCSKIMNNEEQAYQATSPERWANIQVRVPDSLGEKVKSALAARVPSS
jgi:MoaA/NifB/PqqE/SkfB family radical SAM enzyme